MLRRPNWRVPAFIAVLVLTFGMALLGSKQVALAGESNHTGLVESMPSNGLQGNWIVGGVRFVTNGSTEFRQEKGALAVGVCAEVEYVGSAQPYTATKIASKSSDDCNGSGTATPSVTPDSTPSPGSEREVYGRVERMPAPGLVGDWVVNGVTYRTSSSTEFEQRSGPFVVGACVKIHYNANSNPFPVREMRSESTADCTNSNATPVSTPSATSTSTPSGEREIYGLVESMPGNRVGNWVINGVTYVAT
ncbi:MAG: hypothetical protein KDE58_38400, partial [Caldilineaceae bacterium]|nr:hypothetical protein [Caldilineaceae bacterium]